MALRDLDRFDDLAAPGGPRSALVAASERSSLILTAAMAAAEGERDRWFLWLPVLVATGIAGYFSISAEPSAAIAILAAVVAGLGWLLARQTPVLSIVSAALLALTFGVVLAKARVTFVDAPRIERVMRNVEVAGFVTLVEPRSDGGKRLTILVTALADMPARIRPRKIRVRVGKLGKGPTGATALAQGTDSVVTLKPGDGVRLRATLSPPATPALPGDYDFARAAFFQGLGAVGFAATAPVVDHSISPRPWPLRWWAPIERLRQAIGARIATALPGERGAIATALLTGERGGISEATNDAYRDAGIFHILSISGLHMAIMAGAVFFSIRFLLALVPAIALRYPVKKWAAVAAAIGALGYLLISGGEFATVRSYMTITVMLFAILVDRPALALRNVALSALAIMLLWPESVLNVGFQMSFAAVVALVATYEAMRERRQEGRRTRSWEVVRWPLLLLGGIVLTTIVASLAVAPLAAFHFHKSQQYAVLANLIAVPLCNFIVMPAALATLVLLPLGLEWAPLWVMGLGIDAMGWSARLVAGLPGAVARLPAMPTTAFAAMMAGGLWLCLWRGRRRWFGLIAIAAGLVAAPTLKRPDILVGRDGRLIAVRLQSGQLSALETRGARFELTRWLEHDGDARDAKMVGQADGFRCDETGCTAPLGQRLVAITRHPSALADDCKRARIVIVQSVVSRSCEGPDLVIDGKTVAAAGTHAIYAENERLRVVTVAAWRGSRPWTRQVGRGDDRRARASGWRLDRFASPIDLTERDGRPETLTRPEVDP